MNAFVPFQSYRWLLLFLLALGGVALFAADAAASNGPTLQANFLSELVGNRSRMIQASLVMVLLGCSMLWWKTK